MLRIYGGYQQAIHTKPNWQGRRSAQAGFEMYFNTSEHAFWHPYWANDMQSWQRSDSVPTFTSQLGFKTGDKFSRGRGISYFVEFEGGPRYEGQFYNTKETYCGWGREIRSIRSLAFSRGRTRARRSLQRFRWCVIRIEASTYCRVGCVCRRKNDSGY